MIKIKARKIKRKGSAVLLEYSQDGVLKRSIVSSKDIEGFKEVDSNIVIPENLLDQGIPYGIPWELMVMSYTITPLIVSEKLHSLGIWTYEDAISKPQLVMEAVFSCCTDLLAQVQRIAKENRDSI